MSAAPFLRRPDPRRRHPFWALLVLVGLASLARIAAAEITVPVTLQAQLVAKMAVFDRNFPARAAGGARVLVVQNPRSDESAAFAARLSGTLSSLHEIAGIPSQVDVVDFASASVLADRVKAQRVAIVYLSAALEGEVGAIAAALSGVDVLTVGPSGTYAERGAVVGFELDEGRPRMIVNAARAREQNVSFKAELLKLSKVVGGSSPSPGRP